MSRFEELRIKLNRHKWLSDIADRYHNMPNSYIKQGLEDAVSGIEQEIKELENELKDWL